MRVSLPVAAKAAPEVHDLARKTEKAFSQLDIEGLRRRIDEQAVAIADLQARVQALETP